MTPKQRWPQQTPQYWLENNRLRHRPSDGLFDFEIQIDGERRRVTSRARTKYEAAIEAARIWLFIRKNGWDKFDIGDPTLAKYIPWAEKTLWEGGTSPKTTNQYVTGLESLIRREVGLDGAHKFGRTKSKDRRAEPYPFRRPGEEGDLGKWYPRPR